MSVKRVLIFGMTDLAELLIFHLGRSLDYSISAITAEKKYISIDKMGGGLFRKYPIISFENIEEEYPPRQYSFFVCIGYNKMNEGRRRVFKLIQDKGYDILTYIHPTALVQTERIGQGNLFFENVTIGPYCTIGSGNIFYPCSHVAHHTDVGNYNFMAISCSIAGHVKIGNQCFMGNNSSTKNGISIADKTLIGAGAYLEKDSEVGDVIVPVRSVKIDRDSFDIF